MTMTWDEVLYQVSPKHFFSPWAKIETHKQARESMKDKKKNMPVLEQLIQSSLDSRKYGFEVVDYRKREQVSHIREKEEGSQEKVRECKNIQT